ncbi:flagellar protein [Rhizobium sp. SSA_523]|uniref:flagellar protein n=1 Tax=Rhizobium sp. SSA_523 TaxID=2952477 RepID=UPI002090576B|nr:flagellar protein [Rhizobium sp. SSA_523]MCO5732998.1 flagellar protein [Rhizobium sp. SSA_523]WKC25818.1 flagellar protein [Rhizobium sp. SSA_523]
MNDTEKRGKRIWLRRGTPTDRLMAATGILLAGASAFFPWYVFFNQDKFGISVVPMDNTRDLPEGPPRSVMSVSPLALIDNDDKHTPGPAPDPVDNLTTATVSSIGKEKEDPAALAQPFPGKNTFRLMHVANGRALIEDRSGMYMVRVGSILPDNSRLATIEQRDGRWVIVTSTGEIYRDEAAQSR